MTKKIEFDLPEPPAGYFWKVVPPSSPFVERTIAYVRLYRKKFFGDEYVTGVCTSLFQSSKYSPDIPLNELVTKCAEWILDNFIEDKYRFGDYK